MKTLLTLAWRNLWRKKRRTFITVSSVLFATVLAIVLMSMISGMQEQMVDSLVRNSTGYLQIQDVLYHDEPSMDHALEYGDEVKEAVSAFEDEIKYTVPRIQGFSLAAKDMGSRGVMVNGIVAEKEDRMNGLSSNMVRGEMFGPGDDFAVIAEGVAELLDLDVGDSLLLLGQGFQGMTAVGSYSIGGIISFPMPEQNNSMVYLPLRHAQNFFAAPDRLTGLIIMVEDEDVVPGLSVRLQERLDSEWYAVKTWEELMPDKLAAFKAREAQVAVFAWVLYIVAGFGIFGTILTMLFERLREFGILLSIGLKRLQLATICFIETLLISFAGVLAGIAVGFAVVYNLHINPVRLEGELGEIMTDMGVEPILSFSIAPDVFIYQGVVVFFIALVIGIYPVSRVYRMDMVRSSRN